MNLHFTSWACHGLIFLKDHLQEKHLNINVPVLPINPNDPHFVKSLSTKPGILTLAMNKVDDGRGGRTLRGIPFIVTGT